MRLRFSIIVLICIITLSCVSKNIKKEDKCFRPINKIFNEVVIEPYNYVTDNDSIVINRLKFNCTESANFTAFLFYKKFGKWDSVIYSFNKKRPLLVWRKKNLFQNDKLYNILAYGEESYNTFSSIMFIDESGNDILISDTRERDTIISYVKSLVELPSDKEWQFAQDYWIEVDPKVWRRLKRGKRL